jgi:pimeloyl-ACP methyl ester carboxylesterase
MYDMDGFRTAYDKVMAKWPAEREAREVPTPYGTTYVNVCGPREAPPLLLLPGGGATSASWYAQAADLAGDHRVHAVDLIGDPGRSVPAGDRPLRTVADLTAWLDTLLDSLGIAAADVGGHSYGAWIALHHALRSPRRVRRLFLLDPTQCFAGYKTAYLLHALPMLLRPSARSVRAFLEWETGGAPLDPDWLRLQEAAAGFPSAKPGGSGAARTRPAGPAARGREQQDPRPAQGGGPGGRAAAARRDGRPPGRLPSRAAALRTPRYGPPPQRFPPWIVRCLSLTPPSRSRPGGSGTCRAPGPARRPRC